MVQTLVIASGYFNPIHIGHIRLLEEAKKLGDKLIVIVNNDKQQILKKGKIIMNENERVEVVKAIKYVDEVFLSIDEDFPVINSLEEIAKNNLHFNYKIIFANGGDRESKKVVPETPICEKYNIEMKFGVGGMDKPNSSSNINKLMGLEQIEEKIIKDKKIENIKINPKIFKAYDIRGEWNKDWNSESVYNIGKAIALHLKPKSVAIGRDMRISSDEIFEQLSSALIEEGINVKDLGLCGTELTYFASSFIPDIDLSIMITASHNPGKDNGLKITSKNSVSLGLDSGLDKIRDIALSLTEKNLDFTNTYNQNKGILSKLNLWEEYKEHVFKLAKLRFGDILRKRIVIDAGNGIGGYLFDKIFGCLNLDVIKMFWEPDGNFPNHQADPFQESNVEELKKKVIEDKADLGIAYDGDSDRVFFVDEKGRYIPGYYFAAFMGEYILKQSQNKEEEIIVHDPRYYWATRDIIIKQGSKYIPSKVGHTLIKEKMRKINSIFSAECSGHIFYRENNFAESSMLTTLLVLKIISEQGPLSEIVEPFFSKYPISGEINLIVEDPKDILVKLEQKYCMGNISKLDGIGIDFSEWRFNVRYSNTQPLLRLNVEAISKEIVENKVEELKKIIEGKIINH
ncbi:MAG: adenylyltransferase/cytidyltransferase family protein [Nanoarchaeota archaeon]|nr:adenylyltransferase/cytidyltransferase family protein [Nanoarchaeota archaeon]MBU1632612.1 adenylyltransferase/cytidyltransferase family protein [Nanoarchaeota archaeon]MBU1875561.1 adenylyltransferase/cytidyltransferase family protein [Nanoarchaeota archaeon]